MILRKATAAYLLILTSLTLIPVSVMLTTPNAHAMVPFASYKDLQEFAHTGGCGSPTPSLYSRGPLAAGPATYGPAGQSESGSSQTPTHSETNQQVPGVDELDTVKNDGQYVYTITNNTVAIVQAYPTTDARLLAKVAINETLQGIFVVGNRLVIVSGIPGYPYPYFGRAMFTGAGAGVTQPGSIATIYPIRSFSGTTSIFVFDISNHANPVMTTRVEVNGTLAGARLIGNNVYLVATQPVFCYGEVLLPEHIVNGKAVKATPAQVYHSDIIDGGYSFTTIVGFDATQNNPRPVAKIYLIGTTSTIYASLHDIYLTQPVWSQSQQTIVHRINIDGLAITYEATGAVPGIVLNQFSMDEYKGYLRIATANCCSQGGGGPIPLAYAPVSQQETNVYILDKSLHPTGKLEGLSPGEQIYSARFMGDRGYLVTYKRTDPLFVIGLQDPARPSVLGQLNVTGVSDYLQPYDETHLIGIGQSGTDVAWENAVRFTGLKISLFNVTDPKEPSETSRYLIGGPGTSSPAINDHRAVLFERTFNLLVIPVEVIAPPQNTATMYSYQPIWQGAYVFNVTPDNGIILKGRVTQLQNGQLPSWQNNNIFITRTLYVGNVLYTISNNIVQMNSLTDLSKLGAVSLT
ncbi:MAG TPA: beta-propeller domain-containing protein [Candidatus Bathyarchaeia archaeon]|nr:beta-propeller domain-containing protein [Candidatus Bathyarchaeia archaeon]